jgi:hypothetical protein
MGIQMGMSDVRIDASDPFNPSIRVDGREVSHSVSGFSFSGMAGSMPMLTLGIHVIQYLFEGKVLVNIDPHTKELLIQLGWLPPIEEVSDDAGNPGESEGDSSQG